MARASKSYRSTTPKERETKVLYKYKKKYTQPCINISATVHPSFRAAYLPTAPNPSPAWLLSLMHIILS